MQNQQGGQAYSLVRQADKFKQERADTSTFTRRLVDDRQFLLDLLDICVRPQYFQISRKVKLTPDMPSMVIEALSSLYEDFTSIMTYDKIVKRDMSLEGFENEDEPQMKKAASVYEYQNLLYIHKAFEDVQADDASISNLSRILGPLFYQSAEQVMMFYQLNREQKQTFFKGLHRKSVMEIFCKLMQSECQKQFFKEYKEQFLQFYYNLILQNMKGQHEYEWLQSLLNLHRFIMQKMEERYDMRKYKLLLQNLVKNDVAILQSIVQKFDNYNDELCLVCIRLCEEFIKKDSWIWSSTELKVGVSRLNRKNSMSSSFYSEDQASKKMDCHLSEKHIILITQLISKIQGRFIKKVANLHLISFYRTLYFWVKVSMSSSEKDGVSNLLPLVASVVNEQLLEETYEVIQNHPTSTPLHNYIKQFLIQCMQIQLIPKEYFVNEDNVYFKIINQWLPRSSYKGNVPFGPQSYHLFSCIQKYQELPQILTNLILEYKGRREKTIGGTDPRKTQKSFKGSSLAISEVSQDFEINIPSFGSNMGGFSNSNLSMPITPPVNSTPKVCHLTSFQASVREMEEEQFIRKE